jgi:predicted ester cyclase
MSEENVATVRRVFEEVWGQGDLDLIDRICADGFVDHDPVVGDGDREGVKRLVSGYREAFPDLSIRIDDVLDCGDTIVTRWTAEGTFEHEFMGMQPTHERGEPVHGIGIDRFDADGQLVEAWGQWDTLTFMRNIGAIPEQATA